MQAMSRPRLVASKALRRIAFNPRIAMAVLLPLAGCAMPSLEGPSPNALSTPPESNFSVATTELPPVNPQQPPVAGSASTPPPEPQKIAQPTVISPPPEPVKNVSAATITPPPEAKVADSQATPPEPQSLEEEDQIAIASAEPAPREVADGRYEAVYSFDGIEVFSGDGDMCVGRRASASGKLKSGLVLPIACSDDRSGTVKINRMLDPATAEAKLTIGSSTVQKILVTVQN
jgi:hypothetical protein